MIDSGREYASDVAAVSAFNLGDRRQHIPIRHHEIENLPPRYPPPVEDRDGVPPREEELPPDAISVRALVDIGFREEDARDALRQSGNDLNAAAQFLLSHASPE